MELIIRHSLNQATNAASLIWSLASAQYPERNGLLVGTATAEMIEQLDVFALNARRVMDRLPNQEPVQLTARRWVWSPSTAMPVVSLFHGALNHIIHARVLEVGVERLPGDSSAIDGGAVVIPYVLAETDQRKKAYIDPFALAHAFFYQMLPRVHECFDRTEDPS
jgi:hypothetical protein